MPQDGPYRVLSMSTATRDAADRFFLESALNRSGISDYEGHAVRLIDLHPPWSLLRDNEEYVSAKIFPTGRHWFDLGLIPSLHYLSSACGSYLSPFTAPMAKTLTINTADIMGAYVELTKLEEFPQFDDSIEFPKYEEPLNFANCNEPLDLPEYEKSLHFSEFDKSIAIMDISDTPRSPPSPTNRAVEQVVRTPGRKPSPQPTHFSVPPKNGNGNGHRVLRSATVGYIAPEFKGKAAQMLQGKVALVSLKFCSDSF